MDGYRGSVASRHDQAVRHQRQPGGVAPPQWMVRLLNMSSTALLALPGMWAALFLYHRMVRRAVWLDGNTRCGQCGAALRNLKEARCPSCLKRI